MNRFYLLLVAVALIGGGVLWLGSRRQTAPPSAAAVPIAAADGFHGFTLGADSAKVEVTEYSDFECPFCASFATVQMPVIRQQLIATGKVRWRYRDFPLPLHQYSRYAALAAQCAGEQGKFWEMHDQLFSNHQWAQTGKNPASLFRDFARTIGLDVDKYDACVESQRYAGRIQ
ncbi:MAG TPA: thioredoxin domain-containing protein, partial [Gemmatimonadales bacterium]|nr:thioredoxin domain-containing protein [Gemmatimonadales bacterium]